MAKKKKSRLKKILKKLGKVALLGGAAYGASKLFGGRRGPVSTVGQPVGVDRTMPTSNFITKKAPAAVVADTAVTNVRRPPIGKMHGVGTDAEAIAAQNIRAQYAKNQRIKAINTAQGSPMIDNPYRAPVAPGSGRINYRAKGGSAYKKGGRVTGIAKRGFGRALMKGKK